MFFTSRSGVSHVNQPTTSVDTDTDWVSEMSSTATTGRVAASDDTGGDWFSLGRQVADSPTNRFTASLNTASVNRLNTGVTHQTDRGVNADGDTMRSIPLGLSPLELPGSSDGRHEQDPKCGCCGIKFKLPEGCVIGRK